MAAPKRVSIAELCTSTGIDESEVDEVVAELNASVPAEVAAQYGSDYKLVTLHTDPKTGERYALLHAEVHLRDSDPD